MHSCCRTLTVLFLQHAIDIIYRTHKRREGNNSMTITFFRRACHNDDSSRRVLYALQQYVPDQSSCVAQIMSLFAQHAASATGSWGQGWDKRWEDWGELRWLLFSRLCFTSCIVPVAAAPPWYDGDFNTRQSLDPKERAWRRSSGLYK